MSPAMSKRDDAPYERDRDGHEDQRRLDGGPERDVQQHEHAEQRRRDRDHQRPRRPCLALDTACEIEEVAAREPQLAGQTLANVRGSTAEIAPGDRSLDGDAPGSGFAPDRRRAERLGDLGELAQRNLGAIVPVDEKRADGVEVAAPIVAQLHDQVEAALAAPHLRPLLPDQADADGPDDVTRCESDTRGGLSVDRDLQLGQPGQRFGPQIGQALDAAHDPFGALGQLRQLLEVRSEDADRDVGWRAAQALVDPHAEGRGEQDGDARQLFDPVPHVLLDGRQVARPVGLQRDQHIGQGMRHRVLGALGSPGPADDVLDFRHFSQHVLDPMVEPIDLVERRLGRQARSAAGMRPRRAAA